MDTNKVKLILNYLKEGSLRKRIGWASTVNDEFQVDFGGSSVIAGWKDKKPQPSPLAALAALQNPTIPSPSGAYLNIFNSEGLRIVSVNNLNVERFGLAYEDLVVIYTAARNMVFRYDETFDEIIAGISGFEVPHEDQEIVPYDGDDVNDDKGNLASEK